MVINARKGLRVVARKRKGGNVTVAEVCSVNKLTFRNNCHWALISSFFLLLFFPLKWINQGLLHGKNISKKAFNLFPVFKNLNTKKH